MKWGDKFEGTPEEFDSVIQNHGDKLGHFFRSPETEVHNGWLIGSFFLVVIANLVAAIFVGPGTVLYFFLGCFFTSISASVLAFLKWPKPFVSIFLIVVLFIGSLISCKFISVPQLYKDMQDYQKSREAGEK